MPRWQRVSILLLSAAVFGSFAQNVHAGLGLGNLTGRVGGVSIDADGVVSAMSKVEREMVAEQTRETLVEAEGEFRRHNDLRMVSLRGLQAALEKVADGEPLTDELRYLAGLQRVEYVFVVPEKNDIVLAGPGEGWVVSATGDVVGSESGQPVVRLDDLIAALESHTAAKRSNISCSIDPTAEGRQNLDRFLAKQRTFNARVTAGIEQALGPQKITLEGVANDSHLASVLVASDYRMKALAMSLEPTPIRGMPSFLELVKSSKGGLNNMMPRWWMGCDYDAIAQSEDGLTWQLRGQGVKVMTEDEIIGDNGSVTGSGKANPVAQKWSDTMTEKYTELSAREPVFGQLRNVMDLSVVSALLHSKGLLDKVGMDAEGLIRAGHAANSETWGVPQTVSSKFRASARLLGEVARNEREKVSRNAAARLSGMRRPSPSLRLELSQNLLVPRKRESGNWATQVLCANADLGRDGLEEI